MSAAASSSTKKRKTSTAAAPAPISNDVAATLAVGTMKEILKISLRNQLVKVAERVRSAKIEEDACRVRENTARAEAAAAISRENAARAEVGAAEAKVAIAVAEEAAARARIEEHQAARERNREEREMCEVKLSALRLRCAS